MPPAMSRRWRARCDYPAAPGTQRVIDQTSKARKPVKPYDLTVAVEPRYVPEQSNPGEQEYVFAYTVRITNTGEHPAQVISRHWIITDGNQRVREVRGLGVVGQQPLLAPGETFEYTSGCPLPTPVGTMRGSYHCVGENGIPFEVPIAEFLLAMPRTLH